MLNNPGVSKRLILAVAALALIAAPTFAEEESDLGTVHFPNSGSEAAQAAFQRGVAALHSFWYEEAGEAFKNAQEIDPDFALAYWGEAISHNHPLWSEQDISAAREVLKRFGNTRSERRAKTPTERERLYLDTVEVLYGPGDKYERDELYHQAMRRLAEAHPEDNEAQAFYALSYLGLVRRGEKGFHRQMKAGAIVTDLFQREPNHPGAAHYVIHSFDDPEHAPLALEAANRYAEIAPEAHHAQHMPSHIFVQHGMWNRVSASNDVAYNASAKWVEAKNLSITKRDYHSLEWKAYADLQRGVYGAVVDAIKIVDEAAAKTDDNRLRRISGSMVARHAIETGRYDAISLPSGDVDTSRYNSTANLLFAAGMKAFAEEDAAGATAAADRLRALADKRAEAGETYQADSIRIQQHEVEALAAQITGDVEGALKHAKAATKIEETQDPPSGPTYPMKPSHELYGELLLAAGKAEKARTQFETSLTRTPNRTASLLGLARAASALGDEDAANRAYATLQTFLTEADSDVAFLDEVRSHATAATDMQQ
jgi:tetratricopeptide (TPR) repeat protein